MTWQGFKDWKKKNALYTTCFINVEGVMLLYFSICHCIEKVQLGSCRLWLFL